MEDINHNMLVVVRKEEEEVLCPALPQEVWLQVLRELEETDLARVALVCQQFAQLRRDPRLVLDWTITTTTIRRHEERVLERLAGAKYLRSLVILGTEDTFHLAQQNGDGPLCAALLPAVARHCPQLTHLTILSTSLDLDLLLPLVKGCPRLKTLTVENCFVSGSASVFYRFERLSSLRVITRKAAPSTAATAPALTAAPIATSG